MLESYLSTEDEPRLLQLVSRVFTALMHHTSNATNFEPVSDVLVTKYKEEAESEAIDQQERVTRMWKVLAVVCAVRKGRRVSCKIFSTKVDFILHLFFC
jgi:hypothetical protein